MRPKLHWHSSGIYVVVSPNTGSDIPHNNTAKLYHFYTVPTPENTSAKTMHILSYTSDRECIT
jgi:hypothetical protein